ncbi:MAG: DedA family protein [Bacilli bacterium]
MHVHVTALIHQYGYVGVFFILLLEMIGIPFPAETTLTISGIELSNGTFQLFPLLIAAFLGNMLGSAIAYGIGRLLGRPVIIRFGKYIGLTEERFAKAEAVFRRYQAGVVLIGKFIAGIRVLVPYVAGIERMKFATFVVLNAISALAWVLAFTLLGRVIGVEWSKYHAVLHQYLVPSIIVAVLLIGLYAGWKLRKKKRR